MMRVSFIDVKAQYHSLRQEIDQAISEVLESGVFVLGPNVKGLEHEMADHLGVRHAIGVASGTDALLLTLRAMSVGPGDEVVVPAFTFFATAEVVALLGATPVLVDIDAYTYCMDPADLERRITPQTKAIIPVHLFGHPATMEPIRDLARMRGIWIVEDNAQAIGGSYRGLKTGSLGDAGCLSFYPTKNLAAYGDGGMVVTNNDEIADQLRMLRTHGWRRKYFPEIIGYNSRLDELQAAVLRVKLRHLTGWNERRRDLAHLYSSLLAETGVHLPYEEEGSQHVYHLYIVAVRKREWVREYLLARGIETGVYYPAPLHLVPALKGMGYVEGDFPISEWASQECLALPLYPEMTEDHVRLVVDQLTQAIVESSRA